MSTHSNSKETMLKPGWIGVTVIYLAFAAVVFRTFAIEENRPLLNWYIGFELAFLILFTAILLVPNLSDWLNHFCLMLLSAMVLYAISWRPEFDFLVVLFLVLTYPVSLFCTGKIRWLWIFSLVFLTSGSLIFHLGVIRGLALSLTTMAAEIVIPAFIIVNHEIEHAKIKSQDLVKELQETHEQLQLYANKIEDLVKELQETHEQLQLYANKIEDLAAVQERNRLARELHDTVSQLIFSINLTTRSAQVLLSKNDPTRVDEQLTHLQAMTTDALAQLRSLISELRPPQNPEKV